jgi:hypothetical protein
MALEIIGAGFGRTGTTSLKAALEQLGYRKCHHMLEVMQSRKQIEAWWSVAKNGTGDWDEIFEGYRASLDWPSSAYYEALMRHFPRAKVILTVRDTDAWYRSASATIHRLMRVTPAWLRWFPRMRMTAEMLHGIVWDGVFHGRFEDAEASKRIFRQHIEDVKARVPPERLLVFNVRDGWQPLCEFLGVPVPEGAPFPHLNESARMRRLIPVLRLLGVLPYLLLAAALAVLGASLL